MVYNTDNNNTDNNNTDNNNTDNDDDDDNKGKSRRRLTVVCVPFYGSNFQSWQFESLFGLSEMTYEVTGGSCFHVARLLLSLEGNNVSPTSKMGLKGRSTNKYEKASTSLVRRVLHFYLFRLFIGYIWWSWTEITREA
jgi:hypothetical protein